MVKKKEGGHMFLLFHLRQHRLRQKSLLGTKLLPRHKMRKADHRAPRPSLPPGPQGAIGPPPSPPPLPFFTHPPPAFSPGPLIEERLYTRVILAREEFREHRRRVARHRHKVLPATAKNSAAAAAEVTSVTVAIITEKAHARKYAKTACSDPTEINYYFCRGMI